MTPERLAEIRRLAQKVRTQLAKPSAWQEEAATAIEELLAHVDGQHEASGGDTDFGSAALTATRLIRTRMEQTPAIVGWPFTKEQSLRVWFPLLKWSLDLAGDVLQQESVKGQYGVDGRRVLRVLGDGFRHQASRMYVLMLVDAYKREERMQDCTRQEGEEAP